MMMNTTLAQLRELRLEGLATGLQEQLGQAGVAAMSFEERLALLVDREVHWRNDKRQARLLKLARLKYPQLAISAKVNSDSAIVNRDFGDREHGSKLSRCCAL